MSALFSKLEIPYTASMRYVKLINNKVLSALNNINEDIKIYHEITPEQARVLSGEYVDIINYLYDVLEIMSSIRIKNEHPQK